jgi:MYXO-CTERM domain-containing protein
VNARGIVVGVSLTLSLAAGACDGHAPERAPRARIDRRADAVQGGAADATSRFAVSLIDEGNAICSGTLIAPNLVLTARHCVAGDDGGDTVDCASDQFAAPHPASRTRVSLEANAPAFADAEYRVTKVIVPTATLFCGNDIALLILDKLVPAAAAKPAIPAINPPLTDRAKYGAALTAIGFGITGPFQNDEGVRRTRPGVPITCIPGDATLGCSVAAFDMTAEEMAAGNGLCEGDSGSGAYEPTSVAAGNPIVMGVLSRASDVGSQCADSIFVRTDTASTLLIAAAKEAAIAGGYTAPTWADPTATTTPDAGPPVDPGGSSGAPGDPDAGAGAAPPPSTSTTTTTGCAISARPTTGGVGLVALGLLGLAVLLARRRR